MPSVITTTSGIPASTASITAPFVPAGGTKITDTSAPVAAMVSATVPNTGNGVPPRSMVWPALRGLVPPTTVVPAASIRRPCLLPSEPVMPWIITRLSPVRKMAISRSRRWRGRRCSARGQLRRPPCRVVHRVDLLDHGQPRFGEDAAALRRVVAIQPDHDRMGHLLAAPGQHAKRRDDPVGDLVARRDPAEDVDKYAADRCVRQDDLQAVGHHFSRCAPADVEEVRRPDAPERLPRQGHYVQGGHDQSRAVADDADLAVELDIVQVLGPGARLERIRC